MSSVTSSSNTDQKEDVLTNFEKVIEFSKTFDVVLHDKPRLDIFQTDPKTVDLRMKLIEEEVDELKDAVSKGDMKETIDALSDILYVVYGAGASFGVDLDTCFDLVHQSNMSKVCKSEEEAIATVEWYRSNAENFNKKNPAQAPVCPDYKVVNGKYVVHNATTGKVLKSVNYNKVDFTNYLDKNTN